MSGRERAIVLAAGFGERMRPLSLDLPKPLMPLWGTPALERMLRMLRDWGVTDAIVNLHAHPGEILDRVRRRPVPGLRVSLSMEPGILGTGGALVRARWFFRDAPFWIVNADIAAADLDPAPFRAALRRRDTLAAVWADARRGPRTMRTEGGRIVDFRSSTPGAPGHATLCGVHLVRPDIFSFLPREERFVPIIRAYEAALRTGRRIAAVEQPGAWWADLGSPERMLDAHRAWADTGRAAREAPPGDVMTAGELRRHGVRVRGFAAVARDARLGRNAVLEDSIVWPGARVAAGARLRAAIVSRGAVARGRTTGPLVRAGLLLPAVACGGLERRLGTGIAAAELPARGSDRTFARLRGARGSAMLIRYGRERPENERYAGHARFLARLGIRVPRVLFDAPDARVLVMEDLGARSLQAVVHRRPAGAIAAAYTAVLRCVARWHTCGAAEARRAGLGLEEPFGPALYRREHDLFLDRYLAGRADAPASLRAAARRDLNVVAGLLAGAPPVLLHRDLQSTNILWAGGRPAFIDFQGMRFGPAMIDLASLLCDPYVDLPDPLVARMLAFYTGRVGRAVARPDLFQPAAVQRLAQALGAFARLGALRGAERFLDHIPRALDRMAGVLEAGDLRLPALRRICRRAG